MKLLHYLKILILISAWYGNILYAKQERGELLPLDLKKGDIIVQQNDDASWSAIYILELDVWPNNSPTAHCLMYSKTKDKPTISSLKNTDIYVGHAPIDAKSFKTDWEIIGNRIPTKEDLFGFIEYLKMTDFPRYVELTGQDLNEIVKTANQHYQKAYALGTEGKRQDAIKEYTEAIELFPLFYEAIDNRAFTYMELGDFKSALDDFEASLRVEPNGVAAFFSRGECLMKLGRLDEAEAVFAEGLIKFPEQKDMFYKFLKLTQSLKTKS